MSTSSIGSFSRGQIIQTALNDRKITDERNVVGRIMGLMPIPHCLEQIDADTGQPIGSLPVPDLLDELPQGERELLQTLYNRYAFNNDMCLYDLMAFDLYQTLTNLAANCKSLNLRERASQRFKRLAYDLCVELQSSQHALIVQTIEKGNLASIELSTKFVSKPDCICPIIAKIQEELEGFLKEEKEKAKKSKMDHILQPDINALQTTIRNFKQNSTLLSNFVNNPDRHLVLLRAITSQAIEKGPKRSLQNLLEYLNFVLLTAVLYKEQGGVCQPAQIKGIKNAIKFIEKIQAVMGDVGNITNAMVPKLIPLVEGLKHWFLVNCNEINARLKAGEQQIYWTHERQGIFDDEEFLQAFSNDFSQQCKKSAVERVSWIMANSSNETMYSGLTYLVVSIMEDRVLAGPFINTTDLLTRMQYVADAIAINPDDIRFPRQELNTDSPFYDLELALHDQLDPLFSQLKGQFIDNLEIMRDNQDLIRQIIHREGVTSLACQEWLKHAQNFIPMLDRRKEIAEQLKIIKQKILKSLQERGNITDTEKTLIGEIFFKFGLSFLYPLMLLNDVEAFLTADANTRPEEQVVPKELVDFMILDDIDFGVATPEETSSSMAPISQLATSLSSQSEPTDEVKEQKSSTEPEETDTVPIPSAEYRLTRREQRELDSVSNPNRSARTNVSDGERVRLNKKRRKLLPMLKRMRFEATQLGKGNHVVYKNSDGRSLTLSNRKVQKKGTLHGMEKSANDV